MLCKAFTMFRNCCNICKINFLFCYDILMYFLAKMGSETCCDDKYKMCAAGFGLNVLVFLITLLFDGMDLHFYNCQHIPEINTGVGIIALLVKACLMRKCCQKTTSGCMGSPIWLTVVLSLIEIGLELHIGDQYGIENAWNSLSIYNGIIMAFDVAIVVISVICEFISCLCTESGYKNLQNA